MGISRRAYAKQRGISEAAVRKHIASGALDEALEPDGTINAARADALLSSTLTRTKAARTPIALRTARHRKDVQLALTGHDELMELLAAHIYPDAAQRCINQSNAIILPPLERFAGKWAPALLGRTADEATVIIKDAVNVTLTEISDAISATTPPTPAPQPAPNFEAMSPVQLKAALLDQDADRLEAQRRIARRGMLPMREVAAADVAHHGVVKTRLLALPGRCAQFVPGAATVSEVEALLQGEMDPVITMVREQKVLA